MRDDVELCLKWGEGRDRCVRHYDHDGECKDRQGRTDSDIARELKGLKKEDA